MAKRHKDPYEQLNSIARISCQDPDIAKKVNTAWHRIYDLQMAIVENDQLDPGVRLQAAHQWMKQTSSVPLIDVRDGETALINSAATGNAQSAQMLARAEQPEKYAPRADDAESLTDATTAAFIIDE